MLRKENEKSHIFLNSSEQWADLEVYMAVVQPATALGRDSGKESKLT